MRSEPGVQAVPAERSEAVSDACGANRFVTEQPGITTWHSFSAGPHYDPQRLTCGPVIGCDEHLVAPGRGFDWHAHRGVVIVSWVLEGMLRHEGNDGRVVELAPGRALVQATGDGIRHRETNASPTAALRFVQTTLLLDAPVGVRETTVPVTLPAGVVFDVGTARPDARFALQVAEETTLSVVF